MNQDQVLIPNELKQLYIQRRKSEVTEIIDSLAQSDFETIAHIGHRMKGNGISFGFPEITVLGERLETFALEQKKDEIEIALNELVSWVGRQSVKGTF